MTSFLQQRWQAGGINPVGPRPTNHSISASMRRNRVQSPQQCTDNRAKLANLQNLISGAEREYRMMTAELDRLDDEGRAWLVFDLVHKTSLAALDMAASLLEIANPATGKTARTITSATKTTSDAFTTVAAIGDGTATTSEVIRTVADGVMRHTSANTAGGAYGRGVVDFGLSGWGGIEKIAGTGSGPQRGARTVEAGVDAGASLIQRTAETLDVATEGGSPVAKKVQAAAQLARAIAGYNREVAEAFNRRLEISGGLMATRANFQATMNRAMTRYRRDAAELEQLLSECVE